MSKEIVLGIKKSIDTMEGEFRNALPEHIPVERFKRVIMTAVGGNKDLINADKPSLFSAALKAAQDGLLPDGRDAALVPFKGIVQYMPMTAGILKKARNSGEIKSIAAHVVHENDRFEYRLGDDEAIVHEPLIIGDRGAPIAVYAIATTKSGGIYREVMTVPEVEQVRAVSRMANGDPWKKWWGEMARKTVLRRLSKRLPMSTDLDDLIRRDDDLYDFKSAKGRSDETSKQARPLRTLDDFAGETIDLRPVGSDTKSNAEVGKTLGQEASAEAHDGAEGEGDAQVQADEPEGKPLTAAYDAGYSAALKGMTRQSMPPFYKEAGREAEEAEWLRGFDNATSEAE